MISAGTGRFSRPEAGSFVPSTSYGSRPSRRATQGPVVWFFVVSALVLRFLPPEAQDSVAGILRASVLRPFLEVQAALADSRERAVQVSSLLDRIDSLQATVDAQRMLAVENRQLRGLLALDSAGVRRYRSAAVMRPGTPGSRGLFLLDRGSLEGITRDSPVITAEGILGVVIQPHRRSSVALDWTHPEFRVSAMSADGRSVGVVQAAGEGPAEAASMVLDGAPFQGPLPPGTEILTSGAGGVFPRGLPIGVVAAESEAGEGWRRSYRLRPAVLPSSVTFAQVILPPPDTASGDPAGPSDGTGRGMNRGPGSGTPPDDRPDPGEGAT